MEWLVFGVIVIILILKFANKHANPAPSEKPSGNKSKRPVEIQRNVERVSTQGRQGVAGEYYYRQAISRFAKGKKIAQVGDWNSGESVPAYLMREPSNKHDANAVQVLLLVDGGAETVGYLPRGVAPAWQKPLKSLEKRGAVAECDAKVFQGRGRGDYQIVLQLAKPEDALFVNRPPGGAIFLAAERQCAVAGEDKHPEAFESYNHGDKVWATLRHGVVPSGKYKGDPTIDVFVDGAKAGWLSAAQGKRYMPVLSVGSTPVVEARVFQGSKGLELALMLPKVD